MSGDGVEIDGGEIETNERVGSNRIPAESGFGTIQSRFVYGTPETETRGEVDIGITYAGCDTVGLGLAFNEDSDAEFSLMGDFSIEQAREIAESIHQLCDDLEGER